MPGMQHHRCEATRCDGVGVFIKFASETVPFKRQRWEDIDWCDQNVKAAELSDSELIDAAAQVHPYSTALGDLLEEGRKRGLRALAPIARQHLDHVDPIVATAAAGVLQDLGDATDVERLIAVVPGAIDHFHLAAILDAIVTLDGSMSDFALDAAVTQSERENFDSDYVYASVITRLSESLPMDSPNLEKRLFGWATDSRPSVEQKERIYRRIAALPRSKDVESFFIKFCINDDGSYPNLTTIVNDALRRWAG